MKPKLKDLADEVEREVARDLLRAYRTLSGSEPTLEDQREASSGARALLRHGLTCEALVKFWRLRILDFYPPSPPSLAFLVQPVMLLEAQHRELRPDPPKPAENVRQETREAISKHGGKGWTMGAALLVQRTAEAADLGWEPYVSPQLLDLTGQVRQAKRKTRPM